MEEEQPPAAAPTIKKIIDDPKQLHKPNGKWIMDQDSIEFLNYPDELKTNMRNEKLKRLNTVREEMKFILDTDNIEDSNGHWSCCNSTTYNDGKGCTGTATTTTVATVQQQQPRPSKPQRRVHAQQLGPAAAKLKELKDAIKNGTMKQVDDDLMDYWELATRQEVGEHLSPEELDDMKQLATDLNIR